MEQVLGREALLKEYLLGGLGEKEQAEVEIRLFTDEDYFNELLLVEDELTDDFAFGVLPEHEEEKVRDVFLVIPERRQKLRYVEVLERIAPEFRPEGDSDVGRESVLSEAQENRYLLSTLMSEDWLGLRLLALLRPSPQRQPDLAAKAEANESAITPVLIRLIECGVIEEQGDVFFCTGLGMEVLDRMERAAGVSLAP